MTDTYITLSELKTALNISDSVDDAALSSVLTSAAAAVSGYCDRYFGQVGTIGTPVARMFAAHSVSVQVDDLVSFSNAEIDYSGDATDFTAVGTAAFLAQPVNAATLEPARPYTSLRPRGVQLPGPDGWVRITGVWGWPSVPQPIKEATLLQAVRLFKSKDVPLGIVGGMDAAPMRLGAGLHPDARVLCEPFVRTDI